MMKRLRALLLAAVLLLGLMPTAGAAQVEHFLAADRLYQLGLVSGTGTDAAGQPLFELDRAPTRSEAITVLVKLLGKADEASRGGWQMPFTDVPDWAKNFVGYAYQNGLTSGTSATTFGGDDPVTAAQYLTFVLKALGYSANGDFAWDRAWELSDRLGITDGRYTAKTSVFLRGDVFLISEAALRVNLKDTQTTLAQKLMDAGVFTRAQYDGAYADLSRPDTPAPAPGPAAPQPPQTGDGLNAEQVYAKCAPAVFTVEALDSGKKVVNVGSAFFLREDGVAVTNFHVLENAVSARAVSAAGWTADIECIYEYSVMEDWVIFQVAGSGYPCLEPGDPTGVVGGAEVYAVGSPLGLDNTISQGIISNPNRMEQGVRYIQTSASISYGSSGGVLADRYGNVIGITSNSYIDGQNLNLALPITVLEGYSTDTRLGFSVLIRHDDGGGFGIKPKDGSDSQQALAYYWLKDFVYKSWNNNFNNMMSYQQNRVVDDRRGVFDLLYDAENEQLLLRCECEGKDGYVGVALLFLDPIATQYNNVFLLYPYYSSTDVFYGSRPISGSFDPKALLPFTYTEGDIIHMSYSTKFGGRLTGELLRYLDELLTEGTQGQYGADSFGFVNLD